MICITLKGDLIVDSNNSSVYCLFGSQEVIHKKISAQFQANYKIQAARLHYEIYALTQRLRLTTIRAEHEQAVNSTHYPYPAQGKLL